MNKPLFLLIGLCTVGLFSEEIFAHRTKRRRHNQDAPLSPEVQSFEQNIQNFILQLEIGERINTFTFAQIWDGLSSPNRHALIHNDRKFEEEFAPQIHKRLSSQKKRHRLEENLFNPPLMDQEMEDESDQDVVMAEASAYEEDLTIRSWKRRYDSYGMPKREKPLREWKKRQRMSARN